MVCGVFIDLKKPSTLSITTFRLISSITMAFVELMSGFPHISKNRTQTSQVGHHISDKAVLGCDVTQGSILGQMLFLLYVNDIHRCSNKFRFYLFAEDINILYADKNLKDLETIVNNKLQKLHNWLIASKLTLNINKSNFIIFQPYQRRLAYQPKLCMFDNEKNKHVRLDSKVYIKYLGVLIDENLSWKYHIDSTVTKISKNCGVIAKLRHSIPRPILRNISKSFYYYNKNPSGFSFLVQIIAFCYLNLAGITKFKCERKNIKNSGCNSKMTPSCKWPIK